MTGLTSKISQTERGGRLRIFPMTSLVMMMIEDFQRS